VIETDKWNFDQKRKEGWLKDMVAMFVQEQILELHKEIFGDHPTEVDIEYDEPINSEYDIGYED
jgi:hypothetical protein